MQICGYSDEKQMSINYKLINVPLHYSLNRVLSKESIKQCEVQYFSCYNVTGIMFHVFTKLRHVPGSKCFVDPGTFFTENFVLPPKNNLSLKSERNDS